MERIDVAVIGPGNIGTDLMYKLLRSSRLRVAAMAGIEESEGIVRARALGIRTSVDGLRADPGGPRHPHRLRRHEREGTRPARDARSPPRGRSPST